MAIAWVLKDARITSALIGASSIEQIEDCMRALEGPAFTTEELAEIDRHAIDAGVDLWTRSREG